MCYFFSLGVSADSEETRFDAIHIRGVNDLSTERVFDYFREFGPTAIEWIDDATCKLIIYFLIILKIIIRTRDTYASQRMCKPYEKTTETK